MLHKIAKFISYHSKIILLIALLLLVPSAIGSLATRVNYDILSYLPQDLDSSIGMGYLEDVFQNAATNMLIVDGMPLSYTEDLKNKIEKIDGIKSVTWIDDFLDISFPQEMIPEKVKNMFYSQKGNSTMMVIQYKNAGASDETRAAIDKIYSVC
ncbi:MAG: antibiotic ABC transporter permease, partial [Oscillospiraceae bacterium]